MPTRGSAEGFVKLARRNKNCLSIPTCREVEGRMGYVTTHGLPDQTLGALRDPETGDIVGQWLLMSYLFFTGETVSDLKELTDALPPPPQNEYRNYPVFFKNLAYVTRRRHSYSKKMEDQVGVTNGITVLEDDHVWIVRITGEITRLWIDPDTEEEVKAHILAVKPENEDMARYNHPKIPQKIRP